jgi:branched-chain amino acid transport system substrate-binding protein
VRRTFNLTMLAGALAMAMVAVACGGDDSGGSSSGTTPPGGGTTAGGAATTSPATSAADSTSTSSATGSTPASLAEWEALWATQRDAVVKRIKDNGWGKSADGSTLTGPGGWTVDLTRCAAGWSDTEGLTDTTIKIGQSIPLSGTYADYGNLAKGIEFLFGYYNEQGLFKDVNGQTRTVEYRATDDGYDPARTIPNIDEFLDSEKSFAVWTLGSPPTFKTYDKTNERCVPQPFSMTAHPAFGDPVNHPWTTGAVQLTYAMEGLLWATFIEQHLDEFPDGEKVKVASLVQNNDFGKSYDASFRAALASSPELMERVEYVNETIEASAPTVTDPMTTLAAESPHFWISMLAGAQCTQIVSEAAQNGMRNTAKYLFLPQGCASSSFVGKDKLGGDGSAADGWMVVSPGIKDIKDPAFNDDAYIVWLRDAMKAKGLDPMSSPTQGAGVNYAFPAVQALAIAGQLPGGLTRTNYLLAIRTIDMTSPMLLPGMKLRMDGLDDSYIVQAGVFQRWDAARQTFVNEGNVVDLDGKEKNCAWDQAAAACT